jgi:hypothetical protein
MSSLSPTLGGSCRARRGSVEEALGSAFGPGSGVIYRTGAGSRAGTAGAFSAAKSLTRLNV